MITNNHKNDSLYKNCCSFEIKTKLVINNAEECVFAYLYPINFMFIIQLNIKQYNFK